jgi:hypothetical protein
MLVLVKFVLFMVLFDGERMLSVTLDPKPCQYAEHAERLLSVAERMMKSGSMTTATDMCDQAEACFAKASSKLQVPMRQTLNPDMT